MTDHDLEQELKISRAEPVQHGAGPTEVREEIEIKLVSADPGPAAEECSKPAEHPGPGSASPGRQVGSFLLGEELGSGSLGKVYLAENVLTNGKFALKLISRDYCRNESQFERMFDGLRSAAGVENLHLSAYYDYGRDNDSLYLVTDCLKGQTLKERIGFGDEFSAERFIDLIRQICHGLKTLHQSKIVHGNLKPSNIFLLNADGTPAFAKLVDYGIVSGFSEQQRDEFLAKADESSGECINYMSPEQCLGYEIDARSDIYSLGLIMYEMLTGQPLVSGHSKMHTIMKQLNVRPRSIKEKRKDLPDALERIIMKCLEKNRASRYFSISDLELDLDLASAELAHLPGFDQAPVAPRQERSTGQTDNESRIKMVLSAVICAGIIGCIGSALAHLIHNAHDARSHRDWSKRQRMFVPQVQDNRISSEQYQRMANQMINDAIIPALSKLRMGGSDLGPTNALPVYADQNLTHAGSYLGRAIDEYHQEHASGMNWEQKETMAELYTQQGELYSRAIFADQGGRLDRQTYYPDYSFRSAAPLLPPSFPGLSASSLLNPDYANARASFNKALASLNGTVDIKHASLLWDYCFVELKLANNHGAIEALQKLISLYQYQEVQNKEALSMAHDNLGRIYLNMGNPAKAIPEFQKALDIDRTAYKNSNGDHSLQVSTDLAYALLQDGSRSQLAQASSLSRSNLRSMDIQNIQDAELRTINVNTLVKALRLMGKNKAASRAAKAYLQYP